MDGQSIFARMTEALAAAGYDTSLSAIGRLFGVWPSAVAKWRDGAALPEVQKLIEAADLTETSLDWLLTGIGERKRNKKVDDLTRSLLDAWLSMDAEKKGELLRFARFQSERPPEPPDQAESDS